MLDRALLRLDAQAAPVPDLAASWVIGADGLSYRFVLPPHRRWSDGTPLTAADVVATVALVQSPQFPDAALAGAWQGVKTEMTDPSTVTFTLASARASFGVAVANLPILSGRAISGKPVDGLLARQTSPLPSSGPFRVASTDASMVALESNPYGAPPARMRHVELRLVSTFPLAVADLAAGRVDGVEATTPEELAEVARVAGVRLHASTTFRFADVLFNERTRGLDDPVVRHAITEAVGRQQIIDGPLRGAGRPQTGAIPVGVGWAARTTPPPAGNAGLAGQTLERAGYVVGDDGIRHRGTVKLSYTLSAAAAPPLPSVAREIARQLRAVGIGIVVTTVAADQFETQVITPHAFDLTVADWEGDADPDISSFWRSNAQPPQGLNVSGAPPDAFLDQALDGLATVSDLQLRRQAAARVETQLADDAPAAFLYAPTVTFALRTDVSGVIVPETGGTAARWATIAAWRGRGR